MWVDYRHIKIYFKSVDIQNNTLHTQITSKIVLSLGSPKFYADTVNFSGDSIVELLDLKTIY